MQMVNHYDKYYVGLTHEEAVAAGHLCHEPPNFNIDIYTTPVHHLHKVDKPAVLLTTGSFAPLHDGHIQMMESAKQKVESLGFNVAGGYINFSHDSYVETKDDHWMMNSGNRIVEGWKKLRNIQWLEVDVWGAFYVKEDIDFTVIYERTKQYLQEWYGDCELFYVYGSDNLFGPAWSAGKAVCVHRPGHTADTFKNVLNASGDSTEASSRIRPTLQQNKLIKETNYIVLRNDINHIIKHPHWTHKEPQLKKAFDKIKKLLEETTGYPIVTASIKPDFFQQETVSLDKCVEGTYNAAYSRIFRNATAQHECYAHTSFDHQEIPKGLILIEDDVSTGQTLQQAIHLLKPSKIYLTVNEWLKTNNYNIEDCYDIIDFRDFIYNAPDGGLMTEHGRKPYALPYVNLHTRASIKPEHIVAASKKIWELNYMLQDDKQLILEIQEHLNLFN